MPLHKFKRRRKNPVRLEATRDENTSSEESAEDIQFCQTKGHQGAQTLEQKYPLLFKRKRHSPASHLTCEGTIEEPQSTAVSTCVNDVEAEGPREPTGQLEEIDESEDEDEGVDEEDDEFTDVKENRIYNLIPPGLEIVEQQDHSDWEFDINPRGPCVLPFQHLLLPNQHVDGSMVLARKLQCLSENVQVKLLRLWTDHQSITKEYQCKMLSIIDSALQSGIKSVPRDIRNLRKCIPIQDLSCWLTHICFECEQKTTYRYHLGLRQIIRFPQCHGKMLDYHSDHFYVMDVGEALALALPSVWGWRSEEYLTPFLKKVIAENGMTFETDITLTVCSDGVQFFKSSALSVWPIMGYIDGLPFHLQRKSTIILGALAATGDLKHFQLTSMVENFVKQIERLNMCTFSWTFRNETILSRVLISRVIADSPARAVLQGMSNHNAGYGCTYCYHFQPGHYFSHLEKSRLRTDQHIRHIYSNENLDAMTVEQRQGIKWVSPFARLSVNLVDGFPPDVIHSVHSGVMKLLLQLWVSQPRTTADRPPYRLTPPLVRTLDERLLQIRPPERTSRRPREVSKVGVWKAHELSMFLFHYGPILLSDIIASECYDHFLDLVAGMAFLSHKITQDNVDNAQRYLDRFSSNVFRLYTKTSQSFNVHLLRHLPKFCEMHGILPLFSMYPFEAENHRLGKYVNNGNAVLMQLFQKSAQRLLVNSHEGAFNRHMDSTESLDLKFRPEPLDRNVNNWEALDVEGCYYQVYRPSGGRPRIVFKCYTALRTRIGYMMLLRNGRIAAVLKFFKGERAEKLLAIIEEYEVTKHSTLGHILYHDKTIGRSVISVYEIVEQVVVVESNGVVGYSLYLNNIEHVNE